jgi:serine phosphatase RsbU (regulator of sigma subunit)
VVSRGIVEGKHKGKEFGLERVKHGVQSASSRSAEEICVGMLESVQQFMKGPPTHNDVTALALLRGAAAKSAVGY